MSRVLLRLAIALGLTTAGCGPDCHGYCQKLVECGVAQAASEPGCVTSCGEVQGDDARIIGCVNSHSCADIAAGSCSVTGVGFGN